MGAQPLPLERVAREALLDRLERSPVVVLTGARQTGKSTLLAMLRESRPRVAITLDSLSALERSRAAPDALFRPGVRYAVDEIQRAPELLLAVKRAVDAARRPGMFLLTGSSNLPLRSGVAETLAGRAVGLVLRPLTPREARGDASSPPWSALLAAADVDAALQATPKARSFDWRRAALAGGFPPAALAATEDDRALWFDGYVETFVRGDLRDMARVEDLPAFNRLVRLAAMRNGGLVNYADLASDCGLPRTTVQRWVGHLEAAYLITVLPPFFESKAKRLIKSPKHYVLDAGLGLHLAGIASREDLENDVRSGSWLEQLVLHDLLTWRETLIRKPEVTFYRTAAGAEIDFVVEHGRRLLPIEVKSGRAARVADATALEAFCREFGARAPFGLVAYDGDEAFRLTDRTAAVPLGALL